ncbi:MAG: long-chain fatty acid--CoA ligase [Thermodesulfobacteriota bacterium]|nr:long-chain fatty acid--CoA ligase [Thermodesulfobacteriota bacterium]
MSFSDKTVPGIFQNRVQTYQYEPFLRYWDNGKLTSLSWNEISRMVRGVGLGLVSLGVKSGDRVAIFADNSWEWAVCDLACLSIGAIDVPIYPTNSGEEAAYIINDSTSKIAFASDRDHLDRLLALRDKIKGIKKIITFDDMDVDDRDILTLNGVMALGEKGKKPSMFDERLEAIDPQSDASYIYTSGTTGSPKGVRLSHANFVANVFQLAATHALDHRDEALHILPWSHSFGRTVGLYLMMNAGATISLAPGFSTVPDNLKEIRPTVMVSVPRLFEKLYAGILSQVEQSSQMKKKIFFWSKDIGDRAVDYIINQKEMPITLRLQYGLADWLVFSKLRQALGFDRVKVFVNGGGPLSVEIDRYFNSIGTSLHNGYGLSETTPVTHTNTFETHVFGSVGPAIPDTQAQIAEDGEILIKGPQVMKGYHNNPDATKDVFTDDGWFMTGDIGFIDDRGCLHITDRKKDIIITAGGKNVAPQNIENTLVADLFVEQAVVIGEGRKYLSALIVPNFAELTSYAKEQGIAFDCNEDLVRKPQIVSFYDDKIKSLMKGYARVEQIRRFTLLPGEFTIDSGELTPTLKMKRKVVSKNYQAEIDSMYAE